MNVRDVITALLQNHDPSLPVKVHVCVKGSENSQLEILSI
jgi:hypothetical protein